jgi:uncharacterized protein (TIGR00369 family)
MSQIEDRNGFTPLPPGEYQTCFGCSPRNDAGLHMKFYLNEKKDSVVSWLTVPDHLCGWSNIVHGGIVSTMLDEAMGWAGLAILKRLIVSKNMTVDFIKPVFIGKEIKAEGHIGKINSEREAILEGCLYDDRNEICARSSSVVTLFSIETVKKMGVINQKMLEDLEVFIKGEF